jgi:hypothetical protein
MIKIASLIIAVVSSILVQAQSFERTVVSTAGGFATSTALTLEYTIGESVVGNFITSPISIGQGYNQAQPDTQSSSVGLLNLASLKLFPNPASSMLTIQSDKALNAKILDVTGKLVLDDLSIQANQSNTINIEEIATGVYFIQLSDEKHQSAHVKFVKR